MSRILYGMNGISDEFISEAAEYRRHGSRGLYLRLAAAAACVLLTVSVAGALTVGRQPGRRGRKRFSQESIADQRIEDEIRKKGKGKTGSNPGIKGKQSQDGGKRL